MEQAMNASTELELPGEPVTNAGAGGDAKETEPRFGLDWDNIRNSPAFYPGVALVVGIVAAFWSLIAHLPGIWFADDGYYSHGILVPFISAYVVYRWWPRLSLMPVKPAYWALAILVPFLFFIVRPSSVNAVDQLTSV